MKKVFNSVFTVFCLSVFLFSCTKDKDVLVPKESQDEIESKTAVVGKPWESIKRIMVPVRGNQMVPAVQTRVVGNIVFNLRYGMYVNYRLTLYNLPAGEFATSAILFQGDPGTNGTPVYTVPFGPGDNAVTKQMNLTVPQFNLLNYLLSPYVTPPSSYFVITTNLRPAGLLRGVVVL